MEVSPKPETLNAILTSDENKQTIFTVPLYQREYSWTRDEVSDLYHDLNETALENFHFLGSLLLCKTEKNTPMKIEIVDGQQRITTLFLLLASILKKLDTYQTDDDIVQVKLNIKKILFLFDDWNLPSNATPVSRLETGKRDRNLFKALIEGTDYSNIKDDSQQSHKNLINTLKFFETHVEKMTVINLKELARKITECTFVVMKAVQESDKLLLFKTMNARGLDLTYGDLIKNELCSTLETTVNNNNHSNPIEEAIDVWDEVRKTIEKGNGTLERYLFHFINSLETAQTLRQQINKRSTAGDIVETKKHYPPIPEKYIYEAYSCYIQEQGPKKFLENFKDSSVKYAKFTKPDKDNTYFNSLKAMNVQKCFPLLLHAKRKLNDTNFTKLCKAIDALTFRHSILKKDPKELERYYYELAEMLFGDSSISTVLNQVYKHTNFTEEDKFKQEFLDLSPKTTVAKMILTRIVKATCEETTPTTATQLEHIMPQKPSENSDWGKLKNRDPTAYKNHLNRLGNLTFLGSKNNQTASNKKFSEKKKIYRASKLEITSSIATNYDLWNYENIAKRQQYLYDLAKKHKIWRKP